MQDQPCRYCDAAYPNACADHGNLFKPGDRVYSVSNCEWATVVRLEPGYGIEWYRVECDSGATEVLNNGERILAPALAAQYGWPKDPRAVS